MNIRFFILAAFLSILTVGCVTPAFKSLSQRGAIFEEAAQKNGNDEISELITEVDADLAPVTTVVDEPSSAIEVATTVDNIQGFADAELPPVNEVATKEPIVPANIPIEINERVHKWIKYFSTDNKERFQRFLDRGERYKARILEILNDNEVPEELYYLAMIESGFVINARSHASAVGFWQFIAGTGKRYNLAKNYYVDERLDPFRATMAAASYLKDLHRVFDSWYLAMAGYNAGELRILRSIMKSNSRDFWELARKKSLPKETMNYVPKFIAASIIGKNPEKFGFKVKSRNLIPEVAMVDVPSPIRLRSVAKQVGISLATLKELNPHLKRGITPPSKGGSYGLWVPLRSEKAVRGAKRLLARHKLKNIRSVKRNVASSRIKHHRVRRGENLTLIARKYKMPVWKLRRLNGLKSSKIRPGQRLKVRGGLSKSKRRALAKSYRVRKGDNLTKIAKKFGISIYKLKKINKMRRNNIRAGQTLKVASR